MSGTTLYRAYAAAGNLTGKTDPKGTAFTYEYDGNERLFRIAAGGQVTTFGYEPASDNRATAGVGGVGSRRSARGGPMTQPAA